MIAIGGQILARGQTIVNLSIFRLRLLFVNISDLTDDQKLRRKGKQQTKKLGKQQVNK